MEIKIPPFEKKEVEIREAYIDEQGHYQERTKKVLVPIGCLKVSTDEESKGDNSLDMSQPSQKDSI